MPFIKGYKQTEENREKIKKARERQIPPMLGKKHSKKTKELMRKKRIINHPWNFKNYITPLNKLIYHSLKYRQWRSDIFERDNYTCQKCGVKNGNGKTVYLEAHHIKRFSKIMKENKIKSIEQAMSCEELWNINNGLALCKNCHRNKSSEFWK